MATLVGCASSRTVEDLDGAAIAVDAGLALDAALAVDAALALDGGPAPTPADASLPEGFCARACAVRAADGCLTEEACRASCDAEAPGWDEAIGAAFETCVASHPLCFERVEQCMLAELHPPGSMHPVRVAGAGLEAYEGRTVHVWQDPARPQTFRGEARITGGAFAFAWSEAVPSIGDGTSTLLLFYIDVDGDGACTNAGDVSMAGSPTWNGDLRTPLFELSIAPPLVDPDFVCALAP